MEQYTKINDQIWPLLKQALSSHNQKLSEKIDESKINHIEQEISESNKRLKEIRTTFSYDQIIIQDPEYATEIFENN